MNEQQAASMLNQQQQQQQHMMCMSQGPMMNINPHQPQVVDDLQRYNPYYNYYRMNSNLKSCAKVVVDDSRNIVCYSSSFHSRNLRYWNSQVQQPPMMNRKYGMWSQLPPHPPMVDQFNPNAMKHQGFMMGKQSKPLGPRNNWKGKKVIKNDKRMDGGRRKDKSLMVGSNVGSVNVTMNGGPVGASVPSGYQPPTLNELQWQNRMKARKFFPKKKIHNNYNNNYNTNNNRNAPFAPRNTTSFLIRAKKSGGIASLVSPCPVTPAVLPTPILSPSREVLVDMAKEEWGVDGYGSMKGLIRLRSPGQEIEPNEDDEEDQGVSSESDVEEHVEVERRLDHDLSRFEMIYPNCGMEHNNVLENRVDDQDTQIAQLEEENLILKERLFLMERELSDLRRRLRSLERHNRGGDDNEEVVENESENDSESNGDGNSMEYNNLEAVIENTEGVDMKGKLDSVDRDIKLVEDEKNTSLKSEDWNHEGVDAAKTEEIANEFAGEKNDEDLEAKEVNMQQDIELKQDEDLEKKEGHKQHDVELKENSALEGNKDDKQEDVQVKEEEDNKPEIEAPDSVAATKDVNMLEACHAADSNQE